MVILYLGPLEPAAIESKVIVRIAFHISFGRPCPPLASASSCWQFQSHRLCVVLAPHCAPCRFPSGALFQPGRHSARIQSWPSLVMTFSTTRLGGGCKFRTRRICLTLNMVSFNDDLRHAERKLVFKVDELSRLAAEAVNRSPDDIVDLKKIAEGGFNRIFLITMRCGFQMVARIPYPVTSPKYFAVASEVATMAFLRSLGLPLPQIYGYSPTPNNAAGTEYIFMEFVQGINLSDIWSNLEEDEINSITRQLAQLESKIMSIVLPAGGSLYFTGDLENAPGSASGHIRPGRTTLANKNFCVGPDTNLPLWYGRRSQLDLDRGPCKPQSTPILLLSKNYRCQCRSSAHKRRGKGTRVFTAVRSTVATVSARKEGSLQVPGAAAVSSHREPQSLSPPCAITHF